MKLTLEEAEAWYRQDENCRVSAHEAATFYHGECEKLRAERDSAVARGKEVESMWREWMAIYDKMAKDYFEFQNKNPKTISKIVNYGKEKIASSEVKS